MSDATTNPNLADAPADDLAQAIRQRDETIEQLQRSRAEFANYQKRAKAQAEVDRTFMVSALALDVIAVLDNFERAIEAGKAANASGILEGLEMVHRQLVSALSKHGIEAIDVVGEPFDPNHHEAVMQQADASKPGGTIVAVLAKGYRLKDRVLRPAKVAVSVVPHSQPSA